jgi:hypothetical protein
VPPLPTSLSSVLGAVTYVSLHLHLLLVEISPLLSEMPGVSSSRLEVYDGRVLTLIQNFHSIPESIIATWPAPQYDNPQDAQTWMPEFAGIFLAFTTVLVSGRFYLRARKQAGEFGLDDALIFIGWLFSVGFTAIAFINTGSNGVGRHTWDVRPSWCAVLLHHLAAHGADLIRQVCACC